MFKADPDADPTSAMALAPAEGVSGTVRYAPTGIAESNSPRGAFDRDTPTTGAMSPRCQKDATERLGECTAGQTHRLHSIRAINERPAIAAVPIGHRDDPVVLLAESAAPVLATLPEDAEADTPAEATPSAQPTSPALLPAVSPTKTRERHRNRVQRRQYREYASTPRHYSNHQAYQTAGYAGLW